MTVWLNDVKRNSYKYTSFSEKMGAKCNLYYQKRPQEACRFELRMQNEIGAKQRNNEYKLLTDYKRSLLLSYMSGLLVVHTK